MGLWLWLLLASLGAATASAAGDGDALFPPRDEALRIGETSRAFRGEVLRPTDGLRPLGEALRLLRIQLIKSKQNRNQNITRFKHYSTFLYMETRSFHMIYGALASHQLHLYCCSDSGSFFGQDCGNGNGSGSDSDFGCVYGSGDPDPGFDPCGTFPYSGSDSDFFYGCSPPCACH